MYYVYILQCQDGTLYTGSTTNIRRRVKEHNDSKLGAKYTRSRRPVKLIFSRVHKSRSIAQKEEARIKKLTRTKKIELLTK